MSRRELGHLAGVSGKTIERWENEHQVPERSNLEAVAKVLGCTKEDLMSKDDEPTNLSGALFRFIKAFENASPELREKAISLLEGNEQPLSFKHIPNEAIEFWKSGHPVDKDTILMLIKKLGKTEESHSEHYEQRPKSPKKSGA